MSNTQSLTASFRQNGYVLVEQFLSAEICALMTRYSHLKTATEPNKEDTQVAGAYSVYCDTLMESLTDLVWHRIEAIIGDPIWPTYTYYRVYRTGSVLSPHADRTSGEIGVSICLGADYGDLAPDGYNWAIWLRPLSEFENSDNCSGEHACRMTPGDLIIYRGHELIHWREEFRGLWQTQVFLHYVRQNGPYASIAKFDGRPALGFPEATRDLARVTQMRILDKARIMGYLSRSRGSRFLSFRVLR
jgi:hypothetical protein